MAKGLVLALCSVLGIVLLLDSVECESRRPLLRMRSGSLGTGCYFVVLREKANEEEMLQVMSTVSKLADGSKIYSQVHRVVKAFTVKLSPYSLEIVRRLPAVDYIEEEGFAKGMQMDPTWYLDRLDQLGPVLDHHDYSPIGTGSGVDIYILDTGINYDHDEFEYRAKFSGKDPIDEDELSREASPQRPLQFGRDCNGHGTHVSSLCGGKTYGSAKKVHLHSVRVLDCNNAGAWRLVLAGLEFVAQLVGKTNRPSIISMSLTGDYLQVVDTAITNTINNGIHVIVAAGNRKLDSCSLTPASNEMAITVAGSRQGDGLYLRGSGTNFGRCVNIFAPGQLILAADWSCRNCSRVLSGTSMSTPLVSGLAAIMLSKQPLLSPASIKSKLIEESIKDAIDFTGMPEVYKRITSNRLATIQGSCGMKNSKDGSRVISSPSYPRLYPHNLDCRWEIGGENGIVVVVNISFLDLEPVHDVLKVYDGCCANHMAVISNLTGSLGNTNITIRSTGNLLCLRLLTDGTINRKGFNATYNKFYNGTNLKVPTLLRPKVSSGAVDVQSHILVPPRQARDDIRNLMASGYKLTWISSYRVGLSKSPYFDFVASNNSAIDTIASVDVWFDALNQSIYAMQERGYFVKLLIDRIRGKRPTEPSYSVIFEPRNEILETQVYLRDQYDTFLTRLANKTHEGFNLISHSFCSIRNKIEVSSVFTRDRRIPLNISAPFYPHRQTLSNLTFFQFTDKTLRLAHKDYVPSSVEVYMLPKISESLFTVTYTKRTEATRGNWFRWSLNTTEIQDIVKTETKRSWDVFITTGYTYLGKTEHFVEFTRKQFRVR